MAAFVFDGETRRRGLDAPGVAMGMDIIGAYAFAFFLAYVFGGGITQG